MKKEPNTVTHYLSDSKYLFILSIILAFTFPKYAQPISFLIIPCLVVMMTFSIKNIGMRHTKNAGKIIFWLPLVNYLILGALTALLAWLFITNEAYRQAFYILALMPPAVGIISLSYLLHGDVKTGFIGEFIGYLASLLIIPIGTYLIFGSAVSPFKILEVLFYVILLPFILSRIIHHAETKAKKVVEKDAVKSIINVCYAIVFYITIGINRDVFFQDYTSLIIIALIFLFLKFGIGTIIMLALKNRIRKSSEVLYILFSTFKNGGAAMAIALLIIGREATFPLAVESIIIPAYIIYLQWAVPRVLSKQKKKQHS